MIDDMINGGVFGMIRSGKTTLARKLAWHYWRSKQQTALVLDPKNEWWPECCTVFRDLTPTGVEQFWAAVWSKENCIVICDEAAVTIQRDRDLVPVFTMLNGRRHRFIVCGHSGVDLLPTMRQQITHLFLFRQSIEAADLWRKEFADENIQAAAGLSQFEYLLANRFKPAQKFALTR